MLATTWMPASRRASAVRLTSEDRVVFAVATRIARSTVRARDTAVESRSGLGADMIVRSYLSSSWPAASLAMRTSGSGGALTIVIREGGQRILVGDGDDKPRAGGLGQSLSFEQPVVEPVQQHHRGEPDAQPGHQSDGQVAQRVGVDRLDRRRRGLHQRQASRQAL